MRCAHCGVPRNVCSIEAKISRTRRAAGHSSFVIRRGVGGGVFIVSSTSKKNFWHPAGLRRNTPHALRVGPPALTGGAIMDAPAPQMQLEKMETPAPVGRAGGTAVFSGSTSIYEHRGTRGA